MSLTGNLEDVSVADTLQFIHLGGRTGTLTLQSGQFAQLNLEPTRSLTILAQGPQPGGPWPAPIARKFRL